MPYIWQASRSSNARTCYLGPAHRLPYNSACRQTCTLAWFVALEFIKPVMCFIDTALTIFCIIACVFVHPWPTSHPSGHSFLAYMTHPFFACCQYFQSFASFLFFRHVCGSLRIRWISFPLLFALFCYLTGFHVWRSWFSKIVSTLNPQTLEPKPFANVANMRSGDGCNLITLSSSDTDALYQEWVGRWYKELTGTKTKTETLNNTS